MRLPQMTTLVRSAKLLLKTMSDTRHSGDSEPRYYGGSPTLPWRHHHRQVRVLYTFPVSRLLIVAFLRGKKRRDTVLICLSSDDVEEGKIQMNKVARNNLRVKLGDLVHVHQCLDIKYGKRVHILPFDDSIEGLSGQLFNIYLQRCFLKGMCLSNKFPFGSNSLHYPNSVHRHANSRVQGYEADPSSPGLLLNVL